MVNEKNKTPPPRAPNEGQNKQPQPKPLQESGLTGLKDIVNRQGNNKK